MDSHDVSPCRWAVLQDEKPEGSQELVDLPPHEQVARGQELLRLLWEPVTASTSSASEARSFSPLQSSPQANLDQREAQQPLTSGSFQPACGTTVHEQSWQTVSQRPQHVLNLHSCIGDSQSQSDICASPGRACASSCSQRSGADQRFLDLNDLIDDTRCHKSTHSDASTTTPREALEEVSPYDGHDVPLLSDAIPADASHIPVYKSSFSVHGAPMQPNAPWQYMHASPSFAAVQDHLYHATKPSNQACTQSPLTSIPPNGLVWQSPAWQWSAPQSMAPNSMAPQFSPISARC